MKRVLHHQSIFIELKDMKILVIGTHCVKRHNIILAIVVAVRHDCMLYA
jgi:hypothetical protein